MGPPCLAFFLHGRKKIIRQKFVHPFRENNIKGQKGRTSSLVLGNSLWMERLPVISIMEKRRLGEPSWDHTSKAISKKDKRKQKRK